jgi:hypothetical protein
LAASAATFSITMPDGPESVGEASKYSLSAGGALIVLLVWPGLPTTHS